MFGNGPYKMETARTDQEIVLVKNDEWTGDFNGDTWDDRLDTITFKTSADPDTSYNSFEAGEGNNANIPPARVADAEANVPEHPRRRDPRFVPLGLRHRRGRPRR